MPKYPQPKSPTSALKRAEMMKERYEQLQKQRILDEQQKQEESLEQHVFESNDSNIPRSVNRQINRRIDPKWNDVEPAWRQQNPRKRMSWPEFCRDFMGQNYGSIAQDLLEMHNSDDPAMKVQFMKFMMEMGKQGNPSSLQLDVNANIKNQVDIYAQLQAMTQQTIPGVEDAKLIEQTDSPAAEITDTAGCWKNMATEDNPFASEEEQQQMYNPDGIPCEDVEAETVEPEYYVTDQFPPTCPHCGGKMVWQSDFMLSETGYIDGEDESLPRDDNDIIIDDRTTHVFLCSDCDSTATFEDLEDNGKMALLEVSTPNTDGDPESTTEYSKYAQDKYGMPPYIG